MLRWRKSRTMSEAKANSSPYEWQMNKKTVSERGKYILQKGQWCDCKFIIGTEGNHQEFNGHKLFLAMSSPVFGAMFFGEMAEGNNPISIPDVEPTAFGTLLEYIYTDAINFQSFDHACNVCYAAKKYMLPHLVGECMNYLKEKLSPQNACRVYEIAEMFEETRLKNRCLKVIRSETESVLREESFEEVEFTTLTMILEQEELAISSELVLFDAMQRWACQECNRKGLSPEDRMSLRSVVGSAICNIRFCTLTPAQFAAGPAVSPLLTQEESFKVFLSISNPSSASCRTPMPEGFSTSTELRNKSSATVATRRERSFCYESEIVCESDKFLPRNWTGSVSFMVQRDIKLQGVQISKRIADSLGFYSEDVCVRVENSNEFVLAKTSFTSQLRYDNSPVDIIFSSPVKIKGGNQYIIHITLRHGGIYRVVQLQQQKSLPVIFFYYSKTLCPVRSIIFTL